MMKWHNLTSLFAKTAFDRIALVNNHWSHYSLIQQIEKGAFPSTVTKKVPNIENYYNNFPAPSSNKIVKIMESNSPTNFKPLVEKGMDVHSYKKGEYYDTSSQAEPDNIFNGRNSQFEDKRIHAMDNKAYENPREFESKIFSAISSRQYRDSLTNFELLIRTNIESLSPERLINMQKAIQELRDTCDNLYEHQLAWARNLHYFPNNYIPPMKVPQNFSTADLKDFAKIELQKSNEKLQKISDFLYRKNVQHNDYKQAIDLFQDSYIQQLLNN